MESILSGLKISNVLNPRGFRIPNCDRKGFYKKKQVSPDAGRAATCLNTSAHPRTHTHTHRPLPTHQLRVIRRTFNTCGSTNTLSRRLSDGAQVCLTVCLLWDNVGGGGAGMQSGSLCVCACGGGAADVGGYDGSSFGDGGTKCFPGFPGVAFMVQATHDLLPWKHGGEGVENSPRRGVAVGSEQAAPEAQPESPKAPV